MKELVSYVPEEWKAKEREKLGVEVKKEIAEKHRQPSAMLGWIGT